MKFGISHKESHLSHLAVELSFHGFTFDECITEQSKWRKKNMKQIMAEISRLTKIRKEK